MVQLAYEYMRNVKISLKKQLSECVENTDEHRLDLIAEKMRKSATLSEKRQIAKAYLSIENFVYADLVCDKFSEKERKGIAERLFETLKKAQEIQPSAVLFRERADLDSLLAEYESNVEKKLAYQEKAVKEAYAWLREKPASPENKQYLARQLFHQMEIKKDWNEKNFQEILELLSLSMKYSNNPAFYTFISFISLTYKILELPFKEKEHYHRIFLARFSELAKKKCEKKSEHEKQIVFGNIVTRGPLLYLEWANDLTRLAEYYDKYYEDKSSFAKYVPEMRNTAEKCLLQLKNYEAKEEWVLISLGQAFHSLAERTSDMEFDKKNDYFNQALKFFLLAQAVNPMAWTSPVYATNVLLNLAKLYHKKGDKDTLIKTLSRGKAIFETTEKYLREDFTESLYRGNFMYEFARLGYGFKNEELLDDAEKSLRIAVKKGNGYYSDPFRSLAKIALRRGDKKKCLEILKECKTEMNLKKKKWGYDGYTFDFVYADDDFKEIWEELKNSDIVKNREYKK